MSDNERLEKWLSEHDGEDLCHYCIYDRECPHGIRCYGGAPIEPPCASRELDDILDIESILRDLEDERE
ncbi:hypothetical protein [Enterocloster lavalensis]|uniref:hypothetical protein n=1 Tax=Enterocloster lavalensis TaxID=460384 RepID=UPI001D07FB4E|nr:hypothetical protein [Enterocloster lavalensis]MCB6343709.1 hypothetical protein [Enterocloster lavalensis]